MKKILAGLIIAGALLVPKALIAGDFTAAITTNPITEAGTIAAQISGEKDIDLLMFSNGTSTVQVITVYKACASTTTATAIMTLTLPASLNPFVFDATENYNNPLNVTDVCFRKSDSSGAVHMSVHYR